MISGADMKKNSNDIFTKPKNIKNKNPNFKYFVLAFSLFILILGVFSAFLFMRSIDFDFKNIVDRTTSEESLELTDNVQKSYSVSELSGKRKYLFVLTDNSSKPDFGFIITADFDVKQITVGSFDCKPDADYSNVADKYIICTPSQFKKIIASLGGVTVNVPNDVNYKSDEYNLILDKGTQKLSDEYTYKYLAVSQGNEKLRIMCDILYSALTPENCEKSDSLFKIFVNNCKTDISVFDYSNASEKIKIYSNASDRFYPTVAEQ